jgi:hypothetical protein
MAPNVSDNRRPKAVRLIGGLGAAPTPKARRMEVAGAPDREPALGQRRAAAGEPHRKPQAPNQVGRSHREALRVQRCARSGEQAVEPRARASPPTGAAVLA